MNFCEKRLGFAGVLNILKFNRPQYVMAVVVATGALAAAWSLRVQAGWVFFFLTLSAGTFYLMGASLIASWWVYDLSDLYRLTWLGTCLEEKPARVVRIHAGFDEAGEALKRLFPEAKHDSLDFYDPERHREASIEKARSGRRVDPECRMVRTEALGLPDAGADLVLLFLAAHEIRDADERRRFFKEVSRILGKQGRVILVEHLRDTANFAVFGPGCLHFWSENEWYRCAVSAGLGLRQDFRITPFVKTMVFVKEGSNRLA